MTSAKRYPRSVFLILCLVALVGCSEDNDITKPGGGSQSTRSSGVSFEMGTSGLDYSVYVNGVHWARLNTLGEKVEKDLGPGSHKFYIKDNAHSLQSKPVSFTLKSNQRRYFSFGVGSGNMEWELDASFSRLTATPDNTKKVVYIGTSLNVSEKYAGRTLALGVYWLRKSGETYSYFTSSGYNFDTPKNYVGDMKQVKPVGNSVNQFHNSSIPFPYGCFPDRSAGASYYAISKLYNKSSVSNPNDPTLARIGPPRKIVKITFASSGKSMGETVAVVENVTIQEQEEVLEALFGEIPVP